MEKPIRKKTSSRSEGTRNIVIGQNITSIKLQRAKELRRNMTPEKRLFGSIYAQIAYKVITFVVSKL